MSTNAIELHGLWKKFKKGERFDSLRDLIPTFFKGLFSLNGKKQEELEKKEFWALKNINFDLPKGDVLGIIGPNGAGKSTILKLLSNILRPTRGEIKIYGKLSALIEIGAGFHLDLTGRENVYLNGVIMGMKKKEINARFDSIVEFSEIGDFIDTPVKRYSSGMYVRLGFAVAAHLDPEILLIDEVLSVGDIGFRAKCIKRIKDLVNKGVTIVFISHNLDAVLGLCKRTMVLDEGTMKFIGDTHEAVRVYKEIIARKKVTLSRQKQVKEFPDIVDVSGKSVEIKNVSFLDKHRKIKDEFFVGEEMTVKIDYEASQRIKNPVFGVGFYRSDGMLIYGSNTHIDRYPVNEISGKGSAEANFSSLNLLDGEYYATVGIMMEGSLGFYDLKHKEYNFIVSSHKHEQGIVHLAHNWEVNNDGK